MARRLLVKRELEARVGLPLKLLALVGTLHVGHEDVDRAAVAHDVVGVEEEVVALARDIDLGTEAELAAHEVEGAHQLALARERRALDDADLEGAPVAAHGVHDALIVAAHPHEEVGMDLDRPSHRLSHTTCVHRVVERIEHGQVIHGGAGMAQDLDEDARLGLGERVGLAQLVVHGLFRRGDEALEVLD